MIKKLKTLYRYSRPVAKILQANLLNQRIPIRLDLNVTKYCNIRCVYCYVDFDDLENKPEVSAEKWNEVLTEFWNRGTRTVRIMGGEPLFRKDIGKIIKHARDLGYITEINTNGYFVKHRIEELKMADSICLSIDGDAHATDKLRGEGCHEKVMEALQICLDNNLVVRLHGIATPDTVDSLDYLAELAKKHNISFSCAPACLQDLKKNHPDLYMETEQGNNFFKRYLDLKKKGVPILNSTPAIEEVIRWPFKDKLIHNADEEWPEDVPKNERCQFGHRSCYIDADGMMYACSTQWKIGLNYFEHGFDKCWDYLEKNLKCVTCYTVNDFAYAFKLHPKVVYEVAKEIIRG